MQCQHWNVWKRKRLLHCQTRKRPDTFCFIFSFRVPLSVSISQLLDNLLECATRPLTTQRNAMLHFGSDEGAEMAATYHSIISTMKMQGRSAWEYLGKFFTKSLIKRIESNLFEFLSVKTLSKIFNGRRDFFSMRQDRIFVQTSAEPNLFELCRVQPKIMK